MFELLLVPTFSSVVFFSILSSIAGVLVRAAMEKKSAGFCLLHSFIVSIIVGACVVFNTNFLFLLETGRTLSYISTFIFFFMAGYVVSDLLNSLTFIIKNPYNPLKVFEKRGRSRKMGK